MLEHVALAGKQEMHVKNELRAMVGLPALEFKRPRPEGIVHPFSIIVKYLFKNQYNNKKV
jgi:hypothetical protein